MFLHVNVNQSATFICVKKLRVMLNSRTCKFIYSTKSSPVESDGRPPRANSLDCNLIHVLPVRRAFLFVLINGRLSFFACRAYIGVWSCRFLMNAASPLSSFHFIEFFSIISTTNDSFLKRIITIMVFSI